MNNEETLSMIDDEQQNVFHVISHKIGELGIIFKPSDKERFCFKPIGSEKYLKYFHLMSIMNELNIKNDFKKE